MSGVVQGLIASLVSAAGAVTDTFFRYVSLLLNTTSTNGAQNNTFLDSSTNAFSITRNGNTTQGTFSPFSQTGWSNYFDGTGDYLSVADNAAWAFGTGDFTLEAWIYFTVGSAYQRVISQQQSAGSTGIIFRLENNNKFAFYINGSAVATSTTTLTVNQWYHVAVARSGTSLKLFVNGAQEVSATNSTNISDIAEVLTIGAFNISGTGTGEFFNGYISNARIVTGTAVYTSAFTPPTSPLTAITNTSLLTCQSNRFIDNSSNAFAITRNGDVSVQAFSPFNPTAAWSASTNGGSGYFDGTGDYLTTPQTPSAFDFSATKNVTFECWFYLNYLIGGTTSCLFDIAESLPFRVALSSTSVQWDVNSVSVLTGSYTWPLNVWQHLACVRNNDTLYIFVNGTQIATTTYTSNWPATGTVYPISIGCNRTNTWFYNGYISNLRLLKGTALYTANFTPPTAPLTAITNTSLLLNFTNAGIYDSASGNDLETVGNAQVSTVQAKWGTTSMAFDGTGDWLFQIDRPTLRLGAGDFTIEGWVYLNAAGVAYGLISKGTATTGWSVNVTAGNKLQFSYAATQLTGATSLVATTWYYFAVMRSGSATGNLKLYLNGSVDATSAGAVTDNFSGTDVMYIGADRVAGSNFNGYLDDVRITNGYARTISTPTAAFPVQ